MRFGILITVITIFFVANTYHDGKYVHKLKSWKKYYQMAGIAFVGISAYAFIKKHPAQSSTLLSHANGIIKYMPIDKEAGDFLTPILSSVGAGGAWNPNTGMFQQNMQQGNMQQGNMQQGGNNLTGQQRRMLRSGNGNTKRSVSETKKKFVAAEQGWKCGECKQQLPAWFEVDHKIRLDSGGSNHIDNLVALCRDCHGKKTALENL
jgi:hypothetical protein